MPETYVQAAMDEFPYLIKEVNGVNFDYLILSREQGDKITYPFESKLTENNTPPFYLDSSTLYSPSIQYPLSDIIGSVYDLIDIQAEISPTVEDLDAVLVLEINQKDTQVAWTGKEFKWQLTPTNTKYIYHSIRCSHFIDKKSALSNLSIKCYVWNKGNQTIELNNIRIRSRRQNPILYKDTEPF